MFNQWPTSSHSCVNSSRSRSSPVPRGCDLQNSNPRSAMSERVVSLVLVFLAALRVAAGVVNAVVCPVVPFSFSLIPSSPHIMPSVDAAGGGNRAPAAMCACCKGGFDLQLRANRAHRYLCLATFALRCPPPRGPFHRPDLRLRLRNRHTRVPPTASVHKLPLPAGRSSSELFVRVPRGLRKSLSHTIPG